MLFTQNFKTTKIINLFCFFHAGSFSLLIGAKKSGQLFGTNLRGLISILFSRFDKGGALRA